MMASSEPKRLMGWLGHHPLRTLLRIAATVLGVTATLWLLGAIWPEPDRVAPGAALSEDDPTSLAAHPLVPVTVLLVGIDSDQVGDLLNQAAPKGGANADALMLLRIDASTSLEVLQIPIELAVQLPGAGEPSTLASLWRGGGVALVNDAIREIVGLPLDQPQRYVVMPRSVLRSLVDDLGEVEVVLAQSYKRKDTAQNYSVNLQAGRQTLNGGQAEQLVRYLKDPRDDPERRLRQQLLIQAVVDQLRTPGVLVRMPKLMNGIRDQVQTNLTKAEMLSLTAALVASPSPVQINQLPLAERAGEQVMRQIKPELTSPLWPSP